VAELSQHITSLRNLSSTDARTVSAAVFQQAAEACIVNLQNTIEGLCHNLQKQAAKRAATAGTMFCAQLLPHRVLLGLMRLQIVMCKVVEAGSGWQPQ
jgi:hypothetical protein